MAGQASVAALDAAGLAAWPALETVADEGWLCRFADGFTRRANAINVVDPQDDAADVQRLARLGGLYVSRGLQPVFRLTRLAGPGVEAGLAAAGWRPEESVAVMLAPTAPLSAASGAISRLDPADPGWQAGHARLNLYSASQAATQSRMIAEMPRPIAGLAALAAGEQVGTALVVGGQRIAYVFGVAVAAGARGRGHGRALMQAALTQAAAWGADVLALQVLPENETARRLYRQLGFADHHRYQYWTAP